MKANRRLLSLLLFSTLLCGGCATQAAPTQGTSQEKGPAKEGQHPATTIAAKMLGKPYRYGGATPRGFDCSGLVYYAYHQAGYRVPRTSQQQYEDSLPVKPDAMQEGDLLFFRIDGNVSHVGVYLGDRRFIHAPASGKRVSTASLDEPYWKERFIKAGRFF